MNVRDLWETPLALLGAASIAYHEAFRGRKASVCDDCGRLNHATADRCLCGGSTTECEHPHEMLDDFGADDYDDTLAKRRYRIAVPVVYAVLGVGIGVLIHAAVTDGSTALGIAAVGLGALFGKVSSL